MSFIYALVAKDKNNVLADYSEFEGNFYQISRSLLVKMETDKRGTFSYNKEFNFHYLSSSGLFYLCMTKSDINQATAFSFLEELETLFLDTYDESRIQNAISYSFQEDMSKLIEEKMRYYNNHLNESDKISVLKRNISQYKNEVVDANELLLERGNMINLISKKADHLRADSVNFVKSVAYCLYRQRKSKRQ